VPSLFPGIASPRKNVAPTNVARHIAATTLYGNLVRGRRSFDVLFLSAGYLRPPWLTMTCY